MVIESTSDYWKPFYYLLDDALNMMLVNASRVRNVPGRKTDEPGAYLSGAEVSAVSVPATLQATIAARIDRLDPKAKRTLSAAAVIGAVRNANV